MEESEEKVKDILLALVEPNRNNPNDIIPADVKGWRFPSGKNDDEQYQQPVCFWTGVECDPIDGSITGLNLGDGFYAKTLLGVGGNRHTRILEGQHHDEVSFRKGRYPEPLSNVTFNRRTDDKADKAIRTSPSFPLSLGKLTSLRFLDLSSNQMQGPIPKLILQLPNLEIMDVHENDLEGDFPHFESDALRVLDISKNRFHGPLDNDLFGHPAIGTFTAPYLVSLVKFDISHNGFTGTIPLDGTSGYYNPEVKHEESLQNLEYFDLGYNLFSGTICNNFGNFVNLRGLFLEHNRLVGTIPKSLFRGSGEGAHPLPLVELFLQHNSLSGTLNEGLATLPNLKEFYVDGNKLTGGVPEPLCNLELNNAFLNDTQAAKGCDGVSCPANSASREGVAPCTPCDPNHGGFHPYMGQHDTECRGSMSEEQILDMFFEETHGDEWLDSKYIWEKASPACQRRGVVCSDTGKVAKIILPSLGLRGHLIPELGFLSELGVLNLTNNQLTGFIPSDLRFAPLKRFDVSGSRMQGVVPPLLCIKEGVNGNGVGPPGTDFNLLYACENIVCPRGTYSSIGRAALPENEGEDGIQCLPCYDNEAALYMGRDHCTDISIAGLRIRRDDIRHEFVNAIPIMLPLAVIAACSCLILHLRKRKSSVSATRNSHDDDVARSPSLQRQSSPTMQQWASSRLTFSPSPDEDEHSDDDWTAADSVGEKLITGAIELT